MPTTHSCHLCAELFRQLMWPAATVWLTVGGGGCANAIGSHFSAACVRLQYATERFTELLATRWKHKCLSSLAVRTSCYLHKSSLGPISVCSLPPLSPPSPSACVCWPARLFAMRCSFFAKQTALKHSLRLSASEPRRHRTQIHKRHCVFFLLQSNFLYATQSTVRYSLGRLTGW